MVPGRDRSLVEEWLEAPGGYETATPEPGERSLPEYDVCLLDETGFERFGEALRDRKTASETYLPHLLLVSESDREAVDAAIDADDVGRELIDDVLELPLRKDGLVRRIENLLATRRASISLAEREAQHRELVELTPEAVLLVDDGEIVHANVAAVKLFGASGVELRGEQVSTLAAPDETRALAALLDAVPPAGEGASEFVDVRFRSLDGRTIDGSVAGIRVTYDGSDVVQLLVQDRTESRRREERLRLFGRAVEATAHGVTVADVRVEDEPIVYANTGFTEMTGYTMGEVLGRNCRFMQGENTDQSTVDTLRHAIDAGEPASVDILNYRKDGTPFWNRLEIVPIRDEAGDLTHYLGLQRDITEQVRSEQRLAVLDRILRHNVRNKTNVIRGYAEAIVEGGMPAATAAERIVDAADELYTISEQVREFDTVIRDTEEASDVIDLDAVVGQGITALREEFREADVQFRVSGAVPVAAHPTLQAALQDLLYQLGETDCPVAEITLVRAGDEIRLEVVDRGNAIPTEDLELVSTRSETPTEHLQGLELWLLRWAVEQSDGEFAVDVDGGDPRIEMRFPVADGDPGLRDS
jgi:PAS domain S-box-containing protein